MVEAVGADAPALDEGTTVLVKSKKGSGNDREAVEIIVLPEGLRLADGPAPAASSVAPGRVRRRPDRPDS